MASRKPVRKPGKKRVPFWVTMDMTPLYIVGVCVVVVMAAWLVGRAPRKGSIHACIDAYAAAHTQQDTERVDRQRPFDTPKMRGVSCGGLRGTPEYQRELQHQQASRAHA
ncbi:hypothetical protein [Longimicrobium sp.]|uniref:hypothetical protein n=1 Tax=Longimicrobium sp. TaxID=2029185 RepID=UPI002E326BE0|nr:hypothetical protein [Longimicrobium sp.]HEX6041732.1 hypothetical protein [Longimicrobium sp.]